jgi:hypothetical protein
MYKGKEALAKTTVCYTALVFAASTVSKGGIYTNYLSCDQI